MEKIKNFFSHIAFLWAAGVAVIGLLTANVAVYVDKKIAEKERTLQFAKLEKEYTTVIDKTAELIDHQRKVDINILRLQSRLKYLERLGKVYRSELEEVQNATEIDR